jgi:ATP-binding cassette, subfamily B, bacterial
MISYICPAYFRNQMKPFPHFSQLDTMDCGPTCLRIVSKYYGKTYSLQTLRDRSYISKLGVNMLGISEAAESIGFRTSGVKITFQQLRDIVALPTIVHWEQNHFVVVYKIKKRRKQNSVIYVSDPAKGLITYSENEFRRAWESSVHEGEGVGTALMLQPGPQFSKMLDEPEDKPRKLSFFIKYLSPYKKQMYQVLIGMLLASVLQLIFPFLTQALVDIGVRGGNLNFIQLVLIAQIVLFIAKLSVEFIRSWILLHMNTRINLALISDFLIKLMKMPLSYFDTRLVGDILQRIGDHTRIETFLTGSSITTLFSFINFFVFSIVLGYYSLQLLLLFLLGNILYVGWVLLFMKQRRQLDHKRFEQTSKEQSCVIQMITGMQDIKLNNCEQQKRWGWERIQVKLFRINIKSLAVGQSQQVGSVFLNQATNILLTFLAAKNVVDGNMTLGMMLAVTYIIGQLNAPIEQFIGFAMSFQEARISLERLNEIHSKEDEDQNITKRLNSIPENKTITVKNLDFSYDGSDRNLVLQNLSLTIPKNKITAIVGASGSGKTTLVKLLLGFYKPLHGQILIDDTPLEQINPHTWRSCLGSVLQDGYLFSDTIAQNIALGEDNPNLERLKNAVEVANIRSFIENLPLRYNSMVGMEGMGLSQGQKQRLLIARAIYKEPDFLFFDEATNALDANNEKEIMEHLEHFYLGRTVVIVAHRLSTVKNADQIIVLEQGQIVETGNHQSLSAQKGLYYQLVKNQLEMGN